MAASTLALPPEPPLPNFGSPRVKAAMKVLGIAAQELEPKDRESFEQEKRYQLFEWKRRALVGQVASMVAKGPEASEKHPATNTKESNAAFMAEVLRVERLNMERMEKIASKEVQKIVLEELEAKLLQKDGAKKREENQQRVRALTKERDEKLKQLKKEAEKKAERSTEVRQKANQKLETHARELAQQLREANERADAKISEMAESRVEDRVRNQERRQEIAERQERREKEQARHRETMYSEIVAKHEAKIQNLELAASRRQSDAQQVLERQQRSLEKVKSHQELRQAEVETKYWDILSRYEDATKFRDEKAAERLKEFKVKNSKERSAFEARYDRLTKEMDTHSSTRRTERPADGMARSQSDSRLNSIMETLASRGHHAEIVASNRERLRRAHHYSQEQQLNKIEAMRSRTEALQSCQREANTRRDDMRRNCAIEKHHLTGQVERVKDAPPAKMSGLLGQVSPDPEVAERISQILSELGIDPQVPGSKEKEEAAEK